MGKVFPEIDDRLRGFIAAQPLFFVGSAPLDIGGHVNISPKGPIGTLALLDEHTVRLHGRARVVLAADPEFDSLVAEGGFPVSAVPEARRAIVLADLDRISDSCGYGVPLMGFEALRPHQDAWAAKKIRVGGPQAVIGYQAEKKERSIDGLPAVHPP